MMAGPRLQTQGEPMPEKDRDLWDPVVGEAVAWLLIGFAAGFVGSLMWRVIT